jgi:hypothetical protein
LSACGHRAILTRYEAANAMLLNEFLKEHRKVEELQATIAKLKVADTKHETSISELKSVVAQQQKELGSLIAQPQRDCESDLANRKVGDQLELNKAHLVADDQ